MAEEDVFDRIVNHAEIVRTLGIAPQVAGKGYGKAIMPLDTRQINSAGNAHGGAIFTLVDITMGLAMAHNGGPYVTLNASINFLKPGVASPLTAEAREISASSKVFNFEVKVTDANEQLVATAMGSMYKTYQPSKSPEWAKP